MTRSMDQVEALARSGTFKRTINGGSWAGGCEALVNNLGGFTPFPTAVAAGNASGPLDGNPDTARRGEIHYYYGAGGDGHVSFEVGGGLELMGSSLAADLGEDLGWDIAIVDGDLYRREAAVSYRGHTFRHGTQTLDLTALAGGGTTTIIEGESMFASRNGDGSGSIGLINSDGTIDGLTLDEYNALLRVGLITGFKQETDGTVWNTLLARTARLRASRAGVDVDEKAIVAGLAPLLVGPVVAALADKLGGLTEADIEEAAEKAVRAVFADASKA